MRVKNGLLPIIFLNCILLIPGCSPRKQSSPELVSGRGIITESGMVTSAHPLASEVGARILAEGGNAFDAAVAVHFALAVVYPGAGNIGGGGFAVYRKTNGESGSLDFREKAPLTATRDMYLDESGDVVTGLSSFGGLAVGVPGSVDGMLELHHKLGSLPWTKLIEPAVELAENGFRLTAKEASKYNHYQQAILDANDSTSYYYNGGRWNDGDLVVLPELAETLRLIRDKGREGFYSGETAQNLVNEVKQLGGIITLSDLQAYKSVWRKPVEGSYKSYKVISMPPPSSGGVAVLQLLKGSEAYNWKDFGHNSALAIHVMTELERRVYADRATYMGDPDFYQVPVSMLLDSSYLKQRFSNISMNEKTDSHDIKEGNVEVIESIETTHFSIVDKHRNAVAVTTTLNGIFGSKVFVERSGFFLNNEMDDFSAKPGVPNQFGLVGGEANAIAPEKRMLSSMTPTILEKDGELFMVVGTPGGSTIITAVYQTILNVVEHGMDIQEAINAKKTHHQWLPDLVLYEKNGLDSTVIEKLDNLGHQLQERNALGRINAVVVLPDGRLQGGSDPRGDDTAVGIN